MEKFNKITFKRTAIQFGNSVAVTLPPEILEFLGIDLGDEIGLVAETGKFGNYIGLWNETKQKKQAKKMEK